MSTESELFTQKFGKKQRFSGTNGRFIFFLGVLLLVMAVLFGGLWYGVFYHLHGWGTVFGVLALVERVFRVFKAHYKVNGRFWLNM